MTQWLLKSYRIHSGKAASIGKYTNIGWVNLEFLRSGGSIDEYGAGRDYGIAEQRFELDRSGSRIVLLRTGADL